MFQLVTVIQVIRPIADFKIGLKSEVLVEGRIVSIADVHNIVSEAWSGKPDGTPEEMLLYLWSSLQQALDAATGSRVLVEYVETEVSGTRYKYGNRHG